MQGAASGKRVRRGVPGGRALLRACWALLLPALLSCYGDATGPEDRRVGPEGGSATLADGAVTLIVPAGALDEGVWFTATPMRSVPTSELLVSGSVYEVGPSRTPFAAPAILTIGYEASDLPQGVAAEDVGLFRLSGGAWELLPGSSVNPGALTATAPVERLGLFGVLGLPVGSVEVTPDSLDLAPGASTPLQATVRTDDGTALTRRPVSWSSSQENVAIVDAAGVVTAVAEGETTIAAAAGGREGTARVTVTIPVADVEVTPATASLETDETVKLAATPLDAQGEALQGRTVVWSSGNRDVATVSSDGVVTGVAVGSTAITASVDGTTGTAMVAVRAPLAVATGSLAGGVVGSTYSHTLAATGGDGTYEWSVSSGELPAGLSLASASGEIHGTPTSSGTEEFTVRVTSGGLSATKVFSLTVSPVPVAEVRVTPSSLGLSVGGTRQLTATATDGSGTILQGRTVTWTSSDEGVATVSAAGLVTGAAVGSAMIGARIGNESDWASVTVHPELAITTDSLPSGVVGEVYADTLSASGGDGTYTWWAASDALPPGLSLDVDSGVLSGIPTEASETTFEVEVVSGDGQTASRELSVLVLDSLTITTGSLPDAVVETSYSVTLEAEGGNGEYTWSLESGTLPAGLSLDESAGTIAGTPTLAGTSGFTVKVSSEDGQETTKGLSITTSLVPVASVVVSPSSASVTVGDTTRLTATARDAAGNVITGRAVSWSSTNGGVATVGDGGLVTGIGVGSAAVTAVVEGHSASATVTVHAPLTVVTGSLAEGTVGVAYDQTLAATGGNGTYTWSVGSGSLPGGLTLSASTGTVSGTPSVAGVFDFTVRVTSGDGQWAERSLEIVVN